MTQLRFAEAVFVLVLLLCLVALVTGCASTAPAPETIATPVEVRVPVAVPCVAAAQMPARPSLADDATLRALPDYELVITIEQQRRLLREYEAKAAALLAACTDVKSGDGR